MVGHFLLRQTWGPSAVLHHGPFGWKKTRTTIMSGSTVHDLFLDDPFVRAPYHLLEHYSPVKPVLSSKTPPIKQQDGFPWKTTCVNGMYFFFFFSVSVMLCNPRSKIFLSALSVMTVHISVALGFDKCAAAPTICGRGKCVPVQTGYTCHCDLGFKLSALQTNCIGKQQWDKQGQGVTQGHSNMLTPLTPAALSIIICVQASPQHQRLHGTEALRNEASQNERDPFVYVDLFRDA